MGTSPLEKSVPTKLHIEPEKETININKSQNMGEIRDSVS